MNDTPKVHTMDNSGMTSTERNTFDILLWHVEQAYEACPRDAAQDSFAMVNLEMHRADLLAYVNTLLAAKDAEIARLQAHDMETGK